ncbi:hypothetical protein CNR22_14485 [Sphingobacteriaceae bacterium]|nr:hypothetical protein CNR22_14485 [Sphingobacteriaceae bacterium]
MFYRFIFVLGLVVPFLGMTQTQNKKRYINMGFHRTNSAGLLECYKFEDGGFPTRQTSAIFFDLNFLMEQHAKGAAQIQEKSLDLTKFAFTYGFGINNKGFNQTGMTSDGTANYYEYKALVKRSYFSFYGGCSYDFISTESLKAGLGFLLNPDTDLGRLVVESSDFRMIALGSRSFVFIDYQLGKKSGLRFSPYFQYALTNYFKASPTKLSNYRPNGFGFNVGISF